MIRRPFSSVCAPILILVFASAFILFPLASQVTYDDGVRDMAFRFQVMDAVTEAPIENASIRLFSNDNEYRTLPTGSDGLGEIVEPCLTTERKTRL